MAAITVSSFLGENRALEPKLLPDGQGVASRNQKPGRGDMRSWRDPLQVMLAPSQTQRNTIYRMGRDTASDTQYWLTWPGAVHAARGFDVEDTSERTLYTGDGAPKVTDNLALSAASPTLNPTASRPLGVPAPTTAPNVSVNLTPADPDEGKYWMGIFAKDVAGLVPGEEFRVTVEGMAPQAFTLSAAPGGKVTAQSFAAQANNLVGIRAVAADADDPDVPLGVRAVSDEVGKSWTFERMMGTQDNFDPNAVTLIPILSAVGGAGVGATVATATATASSNFQILIPDNVLSSLESGDTLSGSVGGASRFTVKLTGNSKSSVVAALIAAGVGAQAQEFVPTQYDEGVTLGQPGGVLVSMGAASAGQQVVIARNPPRPAALVVTKALLDAHTQPGHRWQVSVNGASPVSVTLTAGAGTFPPAVTAGSLKQALAPVTGLKFTDESDASGAPQLRIETSNAGVSSTITIKKIVPASSKVWGNLVAALLVAPKKREVSEYFYVYTYVTDWGWESAPSPVSAATERTVKETATLSNFAPPPTGGYSVNRIRVYRTQAGMSGDADFFFLLEAPVTSPTVTDSNQDLAEVLATKNWLTAPGVPRGGADNHTETNLSWLTPMWNGMLAGIVNKSVRFCEAYTPYAWPIEYDAVPPDGTPVALGVFGQNLLVLTTGRPLLVSGSSPESLDQAPIEVPQGCIAPLSTVSMGNGVAWASNDGLCWFGAGGARMLTQGVMTREDWLALRPHTIIGQMYEGLYFGSYEPVAGQPRKGFMVDPNGGGVFFLDEGFDAAYFDSFQDQLYVLRGNKIMKWEAGPTWMGARFRSKVHRLPKPVSFACAEVVATGYPIQFKLWADGTLKHEKTVQNREPFRLPAGFLAMDWQVEVSTAAGSKEGAVQAVLLAQTMQELAQL